MAWRGEVNKNVTSSWAASVMFYAKKALLDAGWDLMSAGAGQNPGSIPRWWENAGNSQFAGLSGTGSGGGGGVASNLISRRNSGAGGSGIVVIRYPVSSGIEATGGAVTQFTQSGTEYRVHRFVVSTDLFVSSGSGDVDYLIVGGGGGGGLNGGGNGGAVQLGTVGVSAGTYSVVVGAGGVARAGQSSPITGISGNASSALGVTAGGGAGGSTVGNGNGAGPGIDGLLVTITGTNVYYAAGGAQGVTSGAQGDSGITAIIPRLGYPNSDGSPLTPEQDPLTSTAACNDQNAWFRIREPQHDQPGDPRREFVFLKGSGNTLLIKYSRASGFTEGGSINFAPTTGASGDGVVVSSTAGTDASATRESSAATFDVAVNSSNKINVVVSDSPVFGAFPFYIWSYRNATGNCDCVLVHESVLPGTTSALDQDPTYRVMASGATGLGFLNAIAGTVGDYWEAYGLPNAVHRRGNLGYATAWGTNQVPDTTNQNASRVFPPENILGPSRYSGNPVTAPTLVGIGGQFPKGFSTGVVFGGFTAQNVLDTFNLGSSNPRIVAHYPNAREAIFLPWVPNIVPQV